MIGLIRELLIQTETTTPKEDSPVEGHYRHLSFRITLLACAIGVMCPLDMEGAFAAVPHSRTFAAVPDSRVSLATDAEREPPRSPNLIHDPFCAAVFTPPEGRASLTTEMIEEALSSIREPFSRLKRAAEICLSLAW